MATEKRLIDANESPCNECDIEVCYRMCMEFRDWFDNAPVVDAVEVNKLGELGRLMMPYKGCPRGHIGATGTVGSSGCVYADLHIKELNPIEDVDGNLWVPVLEEDLRRLKARQVGAVEVMHGRWIAVPSSDMMTGKAYKCSECGKMRYGSWMPNYCQNCGAKMDGERRTET